MRLRRLALRVERSILGGRQSGLGDSKVVLGRGELALGLVARSLQLCTLGLHTTIGERIQACLRCFDKGLSAGDLRLDRCLRSGRAATAQEVELTLRGVDGGIA